MDIEFLNQLDNHISNIGIDKVWKRKIGDHIIWFSPLTTNAQAKVNESLADENLGVNTILETKRVTLSNAIVGVDDFDLTEYREAGPVFSIPGKKKDERVKVALDKYIYTKIQHWGNDWFDLAFQVFADLMETFGEENKREIKFENIKDPRDELVELEMRVAQLRRELDMPQLVEGPEVEPTEEQVEEAVREAQETADELGVPLEDFNPFRGSPDTKESQEEHIPRPSAPSKPAPPAVEPQPIHRQIQEAPPNPQATISVPTPDPTKVSPIQQAMVSRASRAQAQTAISRRVIDAKESSVDRPINPTPSVNTSEVVDTPAEKLEGPVRIDKKTKHQSTNPRFKKPNRP